MDVSPERQTLCESLLLGLHLLEADSVACLLSMHEFNQSLRYDKRMYAADIAGSIAYAKSLALVGILTEDEQKKIVDGLTAVGKEWEQGVVSAMRTATSWIWSSFSL